MTIRTALLALLSLPAQAVESDAPLGPLQGVWLTETGPTGDVRIRLEIDGDLFEETVETSPRSSFTFRGTIRVEGDGDGDGDGGRLDWSDVKGPGDQRCDDAPALYRLDGETLTICSAGPGGDRPEGFEAGRGRYPSLRTYRREAPEPIEGLNGDLDLMQGTWNGAVGPGGAIAATLAVRGRDARFTLVGPDGQQILGASGRIKLDESAMPKAMDWTPEEPGADPLLSIYEFEGPRLRLGLGIGRGAAPRPEAFTDDFRTLTLTRAEGGEDVEASGEGDPDGDRR